MWSVEVTLFYYCVLVSGNHPPLRLLYVGWKSPAFTTVCLVEVTRLYNYSTVLCVLSGGNHPSLLLCTTSTSVVTLLV